MYVNDSSQSNDNENIDNSLSPKFLHKLFWDYNRVYIKWEWQSLSRNIYSSLVSKESG